MLMVQLVVLVFAQKAVETLKTRQKIKYTQYDPLFLAKCEAECWSSAKNSCLKPCLSRPFLKPGKCPHSEILTPFDAVCLKTCSGDKECPGVSKCCQHKCGVTCQSPQNLATVSGVPNIPQDLRVMEFTKKRSVLLEWKPRNGKVATVVYLVEERHHTGHNFVEKHLSEWAPYATTIKSNHLVRNVKPGRWYQFRVAAINSNGTKGFSENSHSFNIAIKPKAPKAPRNVTVISSQLERNGTVSTEVRWVPPKSDLPIQRYKVFWSRRLHGAKPLDSVLVHQQVVPNDQTQFLLQDLQPNSLYFLQVQALVQFGKKRLKGQKSELILNTSNYTTPQSDTFPNDEIEGLRVQKISLIRDNLQARITWKPKKNSLKYAISLSTGLCKKSSKFFKLSATTEKNHYDFFGLQFGCKYKITLLNIDHNLKFSHEKTTNLVTPECHDFKRNDSSVNCES